MKKIILILSVLFLFSFTVGEDIVLLSGSLDFIKKAKSVYVEFDYSKTTIDALNSEAAFIDYRIKKEKEDKKGKPEAEVRADWEKDKKYFVNTYVETIKKQLNDYPIAFNNDNPKSDYKMVITPSHMETGNPIKNSSIKYKMIITEVATGAPTAVVNFPTYYGEQMGPLTPTVGMRISVANMYSIIAFKKFLNKLYK